MNKFANNVSVEEDPNYQAWLDFQEVADIRAMEAMALVAANRSRLLSMSRSQPAKQIPR
jgi:hypothetical protein